MSERSQEELRELANKYNAAVNEIKELTDKIKVANRTGYIVCFYSEKFSSLISCPFSENYILLVVAWSSFVQAAEGRQEELTQRGETEKRDLEMKIEEMEEKEQVLQARIEALQADNDFTNERLAALQGTSERRSCLDASWSIPSKHERVSVVCDRWDTELSPFGSASLPSAPQRGRPEVRLNALSLLLLFTARLEQLQEKSSKENNSLGESLSHWLALGRPPCLCGVH